MNPWPCELVRTLAAAAVEDARAGEALKRGPFRTSVGDPLTSVPRNGNVMAGVNGNPSKRARKRTRAGK